MGEHVNAVLCMQDLRTLIRYYFDIKIYIWEHFELETEVLEKMEVTVTGSEADGLYGLLRRAVVHSSLSTSSPPPNKSCHAPYSFIPHLPPQEPKESEASGPTEQASESTSFNCPLSFRGRDSSQYATPLHSVVGCQEGLQMSG